MRKFSFVRVRAWLRSVRNFGKTRFGWFAIFDSLTPGFVFGKSYRISASVFHYFRQIVEELGIFGRQNQIPRYILLQAEKFPGA